MLSFNVLAQVVAAVLVDPDGDVAERATAEFRVVPFPHHLYACDDLCKTPAFVDIHPQEMSSGCVK